MIRCRIGLLLPGLGLVVVLSGCAGPGNLTTPPIPPVKPTSVIWAPTPPTSLAVNASTALFAAATYSFDSGSNENTAVSYTMTCGTPNGCGTFGPNDEVGAVTF